MFFKRQNTASDVPTDSLAHHLPNISLLDTQSFAGIFDEFMSNDNVKVPQVQQPQQITTSPKLKRVSKSDDLTKSPPPPKFPDAKVDLLKVSVTRNDSTASSCYSQPSQRDSDYSPLVTRQSSSSSYTPEPSPSLARITIPRIPKALTVRKRSAQTLSNYFTESPVSALPSPTRTSSLIRVVSVAPDLDKPLPPGPSNHATKPFSSVPDLLLLQSPAELPSEVPETLGLETHYPAQCLSSQPSRMASSRRGSDSGATTGKRTWSSGSFREARLGKAVTNGHHRNRSLSETGGPQYGSFPNETSRRHTVDLQKRAQTFPPSSCSLQGARRHSRRPITSTTAERVIYRIMCSAHTAKDLQATAMVSKGFYRTFQRNESKLVSHLIFKSSKAAWELRRTTLALQGANDFLLKDYARDCRTLVALKSFIVAHCSPRCKHSTLVGLLGQDEARMVQIDDALWRIWTFCTLFGNSIGQTEPAQTHIDWLNGSKAASNQQLGAGFAIGNDKGLTSHELEDMSEMWHCLQTLVSGFHGREQEAKRYGIFDNWHLRQSSTDSQHLAEWTCYLLALGPQTVLTLSGCSFDQAKMLGLTTWTLPPDGQSRSTFLTAALSRVYQERILEDATRRAAQLSLQHSSIRVAPLRAPSHRPSRSLDEKQIMPVPSTRAACLQTQSLRIDTTAIKRRPVSTMSANVMTNVKLDIRPDCDPASTMDQRPDSDSAWRTSQASSALPTSPTADPTVYYNLSATATASARLGATLFPMDYASPAPRVPFLAAEKSTTPVSEVVDPVDKAMTMLVRELGFAETRARKALAMCDTGSGIDLQKAIELLTVDSKDVGQKHVTPIELPTPGGLASPRWLRKSQQPKSYCEGHCKPTKASLHSRTHSTGKTATTGTATDNSFSPISARDESEWTDTISPLAGLSTSTSRKSTMSRASSKARAWKVLGLDGGAKRKSSVLRMDEYQAKVERRQSQRAASMGEQQSLRLKDGLTKNLLGLGLGIGSNAGARTAEEHLDRAREDERRRKEKNQTGCMPRYA